MKQFVYMVIVSGDVPRAFARSQAAEDYIHFICNDYVHSVGLAEREEWQDDADDYESALESANRHGLDIEYHVVEVEAHFDHTDHTKG